MFLFVLGGLKSGKTSFAINYSRKNYKIPSVYIATSIPFDNEMKIKIKKHKQERANDFALIEEPINIDSITISKIEKAIQIHKNRQLSNFNNYIDNNILDKHENNDILSKYKNNYVLNKYEYSKFLYKNKNQKIENKNIEYSSIEDNSIKEDNFESNNIEKNSIGKNDFKKNNLKKNNKVNKISVVFDCFTMWLNNLFYYKMEDKWEIIFDKFIKNISENDKFDFIFISNEVNCGNVSQNYLTRKYNHILGLINIKIASISNNVYVMHAGIPLKIKEE